MVRFYRSTWGQMAGLLILGGLLALGWRFIGPEPVAPPPALKPAEPAGLNPVGIDRVMELHGQGVLFLDLRPADVFEAGHIPGAKLYATGRKQAGELVVLYGGPADFNAALTKGQNLIDQGFKWAFVFLEGWDGWQAAGLPVQGGGS